MWPRNTVRQGHQISAHTSLDFVAYILQMIRTIDVERLSGWSQPLALSSTRHVAELKGAQHV